MEDPKPDSARRSFLNWFLGSSVAALFASAIYPVVRFMSPPSRPEATTNRIEAGQSNDPELLERGYKILRFGVEPVILVRAASGDLRAFAATCTHLDCIVEFQPKKRRLWCNCHNGGYDLNGRVIAGPPPKPLLQYEVHVLESTSGPGTIVISRA